MNIALCSVICNKDGTTTIIAQNGGTEVLQPGESATIDMDVFITT